MVKIPLDTGDSIKVLKATFDINVKSGFVLLLELTLCRYFVIINPMIIINIKENYYDYGLL